LTLPFLCVRPAPPVTDPLSLHDALPIFPERSREISLVEGDRSLFSVLQGAMSVASAGGEDRAPAGDEVVGPLTDADPAGQKEKRSEEHTSELQSREKLVCRLLLEKKKRK